MLQRDLYFYPHTVLILKLVCDEENNYNLFTEYISLLLRKYRTGYLLIYSSREMKKCIVQLLINILQDSYFIRTKNTLILCTLLYESQVKQSFGIVEGVS